MLKVQEIREIIKLIDDSSITEFNYKTEGANISLKKGNASKRIEQQVNLPVEEAPKVAAQEVKEQPKPVEVKAEEKVKSEAEPENTEASTQDYDYEVVSPMVGTFYAAPSPEDEDYVEVGSKVEPQTVVCIVEAMKLFNEIEAEVNGEIVEIIVSNGELVEYGQPLFRVKKK